MDGLDYKPSESVLHGHIVLLHSSWSDASVMVHCFGIRYRILSRILLVLKLAITNRPIEALLRAGLFSRSCLEESRA